MLYHSKAHIWLPIWLLWTTSLYLVPFSRYSTSKFLGFDLDLWTLKVIWGRKNLYRSKAHIWLPIWLLWTTSLHLVPFSRYSTSKFLGFDLDLWTLKVIWGRKNLYRSKAHIWLPIWLLWTTSLHLVPFSRYSTSKYLGFDLDLWPLKVIWGQNFLYHCVGPNTAVFGITWLCIVDIVNDIISNMSMSLLYQTRAHCWTISSKKSKKKNLFFTWPYRGHRRNPFFLSGVSVVPLKAVDYL